MSDIEERIIRVIGNGKERYSEIEHWKEFHCFGRKNIDEVCGNCKLRFKCFTDREYVEISIKDLHEKSLRDVTVKTLVQNLTKLVCKIENDKFNKGHAKLDFTEVIIDDDL